MLQNLKIEWEPEFYQVQLSFDLPGDVLASVNAIWAAIGGGTFGVANVIDCEDDIWINATIWFNGKRYYIGANVEIGKLILATDRELFGEDALDGTVPYDEAPDLDLQWVPFIQPLKKIMEILQ